MGDTHHLAHKMRYLTKIVNQQNTIKLNLPS